MPTHVAFLRGVNVGGHNRMTMDDLRAVVASLGYDDVRTYFQSGNAVFEATEADEATLRRDLHDAIEAEFGYDVTVMVRTWEALGAVVAGQPFEVTDEAGIRHYVTFLTESPDGAAVAALDAAQSDAERFVLRDREVYSELDKDALGDGRFTDVGSVLGLEATRRNWDVVQSVLELAAS